MREIPVPTSVSAEARRIIAMGALNPPIDYPPVGDTGAWRDLVAERDAATLAMIGDRAAGLPVTFDEIDADGVRVFAITPTDTDPSARRVYLHVHGGGFAFGGGEVCRLLSIRTALQVGACVWAVDYRMPPDHPYPAPLDDCVSAYRALLGRRSAGEIVVGGESAGGNLAAALILRARDEGMPLPAGAVLLTPEADLTESGDSFETNAGLDSVLPGSLMATNLLYAAGHDLTHPYLSPLFADFTRGFPPTMLRTGTRDLFLSNTVLLHRALRSAGVAADLHVMEAAGHGGFLGAAPEDREIDREIRAFVDARWADAERDR